MIFEGTKMLQNLQLSDKNLLLTIHSNENIVHQVQVYSDIQP
jgi:hypothetical protein